MDDFGAVVFDILGTLVDEPTGLRGTFSRVLDLDPGTAAADDLVALWQRHVEAEQHSVIAGRRPFVPSHVIDTEAAALVAKEAGRDTRATVDALSRAGWTPPPWSDSVQSLRSVAVRYPTLGLSSASRRTLTSLNQSAGLRWHQVLSGEDINSYKPAPEVYQLAMAATGLPAEKLLMVAAHAWDLRGAAAVGLQTAYVQRPAGDPPAPDDAFDFHFADLAELAIALTR